MEFIARKFDFQPLLYHCQITEQIDEWFSVIAMTAFVLPVMHFLIFYILHCVRLFNRTEATVLMKTKFGMQNTGMYGCMESTYCCSYRSQHMLKLWACRSFTMPHVPRHTDFLPSSPKHPRACAMFWMTAYRNCLPLCFAVIYRNLTPLVVFFFFLFLFAPIDPIDTCFLSLWQCFSTFHFFPPRNSRICIPCFRK